MSVAVGTVLPIRWRKWDGTPHWAGDCVHLGSDQWGDWFGKPVGWRYDRPGASYTIASPSIALLPAGSADHVVGLNRRHPRGLRVYIDLAWDVRWDAEGITAIDMDLDVVRRLDERGTYVDDRDEWAEHGVRYGYPADVMAHLEALAVDLENRVRTQVPPFDDATADLWLDRLETGTWPAGERN